MAQREGTLCLLCGEEKSNHNFVKHRNDLMYESVGFCKECVRDKVDADDNGSVLDMLRILNIPFVNSVWENAVEKDDKTTFMKYLQMVAAKRSYKNFSDTDRGGSEGQLEDFVITKKVMLRWGSGKSKDQYYDMEADYERLCGIKSPSNRFEEELYVKNVKLGQALNDALESGDSKSISSLRKAYFDDLKNLGLDLSSISIEDVDSLGLRIKTWENNKPVPEIDDEFNDVDGIQEYVNKYFVIPIKRIFGQASEEEVAHLHE